MTRYEKHLLGIIAELLSADMARGRAEHNLKYLKGDDPLERRAKERAVRETADRYAKAVMAASQELIESNEKKEA